MSEPLTDDQLIERHSDETFRVALNRLLDLRALVEECIISADYKVTQPMYDPLELTEEGQRLVEKLRQRGGIPYPQARFICFLQMLQVDLLIDPVATDIDRLVDVLSEQVKNLQIRYPYTYGRLLYDKVHDLGLNGKNRISHKETLELLNGTPQGVFQVGGFIVGPFGIMQTEHRRSCGPHLVAGYHCPDLTCNTLHYHALETSRDAPINESLETAGRIIRKEYPAASDWQGYFAKLSIYPANPYDDFSGDPLVYLIGDALSLDELRKLVAHLLDSTNGKLRGVLREKTGLGGPAVSIAGQLGPAELVQIALTASNKDLFSALDALVASGQIEVPAGEVRRAVVNRWKEGAFDLRAELSRFGVRLQPDDASLGPLRLRRLVRQMYRFDSEEDRLDLAWHLQVRSEGTETLDAVVEQYLQSSTPRQAVTTLLLARRSNFIVTAEKLMLNEKVLFTDDERVNAVLWKLGFSVEDLLDPHARFWALHERMLSLTRQSVINPLGPDEEQIRSQAVNYFVALEDLLKDALLFATWALTTDHFSAGKPFLYRPNLEKEMALRALKERADLDTDTDGRPRLSIDDKMTLYPLTRGFGLLADVLRSLQVREKEFLREESRIPVWIKSQTLQRFPFTHTIPFLDLLPDGQSDILDSLQEISRRLVGADVSEARNEWLHPRRRGQNMEQLRASLDAVRDAVAILQDKGLSRQVYRFVRRELDEAGRSTVVLVDSRGQEHVLFRPSGLAWLGLPRLQRPQHIMVSAKFSEPSEVLRFATQEDSPYARLWMDFPLRPRKATDPGTAHLYVGKPIPSQREP
ncbi:hypothetical protein V6U89_08610 [Micromonospora sp. CPCC 206171]|uniref:hypothetical protein n=1 Tax=Micromonospora sp. CPCC 206171 TaxID=3122405 RepID=UPI002FEF3E9B